MYVFVILLLGDLTMNSRSRHFYACTVFLDKWHFLWGLPFTVSIKVGASSQPPLFHVNPQLMMFSRTTGSLRASCQTQWKITQSQPRRKGSLTSNLIPHASSILTRLTSTSIHPSLEHWRMDCSRTSAELMWVSSLYGSLWKISYLIPTKRS